MSIGVGAFFLHVNRFISCACTGDVSVTWTPREISGRELLSDIRAGIDDCGLMAKYEVTKRQLKGLLKQLADAGVLSALQRLALELSAKEFVRDIRAGLDLLDLREKYGVTVEEITGVSEMFLNIGLLDAGALEPEALWVNEPFPEISEHQDISQTEAALESTVPSEIPEAIFHYFPNSVLVNLRSDADAVERRLDEGMDPNARDRHHRRPALIWAAGYGNIEAVGLLVDKGADLHATGRDAKTALHFATAKKHADVRELLLSRGAMC